MTNIALASKALSVEISPLGAELQSIRDGEGRDYLHDGSSFWGGRAPLLFPIVGALKNDSHSVDGVAYHLPKHGFARNSLFDVAELRQDWALFRLTDSKATHAHYPYQFVLDVAFSISGSTLKTEATVTNTDMKPLPVAFGFHPAFKWPLPGAGAKLDHAIEFAENEPGALTRIDADGLVARQLPTPIVGKRLALRDDLFEDDALIFLDLKSRSLRFGPAEGGSPSLKIDFETMPHLGIWTKPGAPYLCIEPWSGYASPASYAGPLTEKPGSVNLAPGEAKTFAMSVELIGA